MEEDVKIFSCQSGRDKSCIFIFSPLNPTQFFSVYSTESDTYLMYFKMTSESEGSCQIYPLTLSHACLNLTFCACSYHQCWNLLLTASPLRAESDSTEEAHCKWGNRALSVYSQQPSICRVDACHVPIPVPLMILLTLELVDPVKMNHVEQVMKKYCVLVPSLTEPPCIIYNFIKLK